ncbi:MAG: hypothetical protein GX230_02770 [Lentisphaerae bacterium]|nr:hypothetical protein [Lentisphaerota bacterium]
MNPPTITWEAVIGGVYRIERTLSLTTPTWELVETVTATVEPMTRGIPNDQPAAFFRVIRTH